MASRSMRDTLTDFYKQLQMWQHIFGLLRRQARAVEDFYDGGERLSYGCRSRVQWQMRRLSGYGGEVPLACLGLPRS